MAKENWQELTAWQDKQFMLTLPKTNIFQETTSQSYQVASQKSVKYQDITPWDEELYRSLISTKLTDNQRQLLMTPNKIFPRQTEAMAIHWHPEFIPLDICLKRFLTTFPNLKKYLLIPTQHNQLLALNDYAGVEVDCYSSGFNRKVQLLLHLRADKISKAHSLNSMLTHTFKYRSSQFFELIDSIIDPHREDQLQKAAAFTGSNEEIVNFVRSRTYKLRQLVKIFESITPPQMIKNKVLIEYFHAQRNYFPNWLVSRALILLKAIKNLIKRDFSLQYFYRASEFISEIRSLDGGIIIPHPEQFWPILLADYDVDGYEVWNPTSREYTDFLIGVVNRKNKHLRLNKRKILIFMGDDTHMSEKAKDFYQQDAEKASREIGVQPAWEEISIRKGLMLAGESLGSVIEEYKTRLS